PSSTGRYCNNNRINCSYSDGNLDFGMTCSGVLVENKVIATAGHCITNKRNISSLKIVFGYYNNGNGMPPLKIISASRYIGGNYSSQNTCKVSDWALIELAEEPFINQTANSPDQQVAKVPIRSKTVDDTDMGKNVYLMGYPYSMRLKMI